MKNTNPTTPSGQVGDDHFFVDKSGPVLFTCMRMIVALGDSILPCWPKMSYIVPPLLSIGLYGAHIGMGPRALPPNLPMDGDQGLDHHHNHLINGLQILNIQTICTANPMVQTIQMGAELGIDDYRR